MEKRIQSVQRAINILNCFNEDAPVLTLSHISELLDLNINTVRGLVNTLVANGLLIHNTTDNTYTLGLYFILKSNLIYDTRHLENLVDIAEPYLQRISEKYSVFSSIQVVSQSSIYMVKSIQPPASHYRITAQLYEPLSYHCTSSGKLYLQYLSPNNLQTALESINYECYTANTISCQEELLEELERQKKNYYSLEVDERSMGFSSIAVPLLRSGNRLLGTVSVADPTQVIREQLTPLSRDLIDVSGEMRLKLKTLPEFILE